MYINRHKNTQADTCSTWRQTHQHYLCTVMRTKHCGIHYWQKDTTQTAVRLKRVCAKEKRKTSKPSCLQTNVIWTEKVFITNRLSKSGFAEIKPILFVSYDTWLKTSIMSKTCYKAQHHPDVWNSFISLVIYLLFFCSHRKCRWGFSTLKMLNVVGTKEAHCTHWVHLNLVNLWESEKHSFSNVHNPTVTTDNICNF